MSTKREPLLSERLWEIIKSLDGNVADWVIDDLSEIHEELDNKERARAKDAELIQRLVDGLHHAQKFAATYGYGPLETINWDLEVASAAGFKPS